MPTSRRPASCRWAAQRTAARAPDERHEHRRHAAAPRLRAPGAASDRPPGDAGPDHPEGPPGRRGLGRGIAAARCGIGVLSNAQARTTSTSWPRSACIPDGQVTARHRRRRWTTLATHDRPRLHPVRDLEASAAFYDAVLAPLGGRRIMDFGDAIGYGTDFPTSGSAPTDRHGRPRVAPRVPRPRPRGRAGVPRRRRRAGAEVLHEPRVWPEYHPGYFGAFVRDPDGNNVEAVHHTFEQPS